MNLDYCRQDNTLNKHLKLFNIFCVSFTSVHHVDREDRTSYKHCLSIKLHADIFNTFIIVSAPSTHMRTKIVTFKGGHLIR